MIGKHWGSVDKFVQDFNARAAGVQGSGWCWLGYDKAMGRLVIETTPNQDPLVTKARGVDGIHNARLAALISSVAPPPPTPSLTAPRASARRA